MVSLEQLRAADPPSSGQSAEQPKPKKKKEKSEIDVESREKGFFVNMPTLMIPIVERDNFDYFYVIKIMLEFEDQWDAVKFRNQWPEVKDAIIQDLYGIAPTLSRSQLMLSEELIRQRVPRTVKKVMKKNGSKVKIHIRRIEKRQINRGDAAEF